MTTSEGGVAAHLAENGTVGPAPHCSSDGFQALGRRILGRLDDARTGHAMFLVLTVSSIVSSAGSASTIS